MTIYQRFVVKSLYAIQMYVMVIVMYQLMEWIWLFPVVAVVVLFTSNPVADILERRIQNE